MFKHVLIANRGEVAIRIARALAELGVASLAVYGSDDADCLHVTRADAAVALPGRGAAAYLDGDTIIAVARAEGCDAIHPGYGFLSENAGFARACAAAGLTFIGPKPQTLALFGDKAAARRLAAEVGVTLAAGTTGITTLAEAEAFMAGLGGRPVMVKALAGGGGRGMRVVEHREALAEAFARAASEAMASFGADGLYVEELIRPPAMSRCRSSAMSRAPCAISTSANAACSAAIRSLSRSLPHRGSIHPCATASSTRP